MQVNSIRFNWIQCISSQFNPNKFTPIQFDPIHSNPSKPIQFIITQLIQIQLNAIPSKSIQANPNQFFSIPDQLNTSLAISNTI